MKVKAGLILGVPAEWVRYTISTTGISGWYFTEILI